MQHSVYEKERRWALDGVSRDDLQSHGFPRASGLAAGDVSEPGTSFEDMCVVLDQDFRASICLTNLALSAIAAKEPVVAQYSSVLLLRDPDALSRLLLEALKGARAHGHVRAQLQVAHGSSSLVGYAAMNSSLANSRCGPFSLPRGRADRLDVTGREPRVGTRQNYSSSPFLHTVQHDFAPRFDLVIRPTTARTIVRDRRSIARRQELQPTKPWSRRRTYIRAAKSRPWLPIPGFLAASR